MSETLVAPQLPQRSPRPVHVLLVEDDEADAFYVEDVLADLRAIRCDLLTLGQYLAPTLKHSIPVARYVPPAEFDALAARARLMGFRQVVAGPFVRSSYHADEMVPSRDAAPTSADHPA